MSPWIIDSRASDHMTGDATIFQNYTPYFGDCTIHIADGFLSKVDGICSIVISKDLNLGSILLFQTWIAICCPLVNSLEKRIVLLNFS